MRNSLKTYTIYSYQAIGYSSFVFVQSPYTPVSRDCIMSQKSIISSRTRDNMKKLKKKKTYTVYSYQSIGHSTFVFAHSLYHCPSVVERLYTETKKYCLIWDTRNYENTENETPEPCNSGVHSLKSSLILLIFPHRRRNFVHPAQKVSSEPRRRSNMQTVLNIRLSQCSFSLIPALIFETQKPSI